MRNALYVITILQKVIIMGNNFFKKNIGKRILSLSLMACFATQSIQASDFAAIPDDVLRNVSSYLDAGSTKKLHSTNKAMFYAALSDASDKTICLMAKTFTDSDIEYLKANKEDPFHPAAKFVSRFLEADRLVPVLPRHVFNECFIKDSRRALAPPVLFGCVSVLFPLVMLNKLASSVSLPWNEVHGTYTQSIGQMDDNMITFQDLYPSVAALMGFSSHACVLSGSAILLLDCIKTIGRYDEEIHVVDDSVLGELSLREFNMLNTLRDQLS